ncbi:MAG: galactose-1-phosphate uridylyltransferase, partial [Luminiphilus sp.]
MFSEVSHRRRNPLTGDWVLVSPQRGARPWSGEQTTNQDPTLPEHDAVCPLCPGNKRHGDASNPLYQGPFVFRNDFSALSDASLPAEELAPPGQGRI